MRYFDGMFETHLTVPQPARPVPRGRPEGDDVLERWARRHGMKYTKILLDRGRTPRQPMLTYHGSGTLPAQRESAREWVARLHGDGFDVARVKVEAAPWNEDVPRSAEQARALPPECYFEHHVKLVLADEAEVDAVRRIGARHAGHVSRNARRVLDGGRHQRFVTQRFALVGRPEAHRRLEALLAELAGAGHHAVEVEEEFVVHDDNPGLDRGWADA